MQLSFVSGRISGGARALEAAAAAHAMLVMLGTDPAHGLLPVATDSDSDASAQDGDQHRTGSKGVSYSRALFLALES